MYANGIISRDYLPGSDMVVKVDVTANHKGFFTFKLCANNNTSQDPRQDCFDRTVLKVTVNLVLIFLGAKPPLRITFNMTIV